MLTLSLVLIVTESKGKKKKKSKKKTNPPLSAANDNGGPEAASQDVATEAAVPEHSDESDPDDEPVPASVSEHGEAHAHEVNKLANGIRTTGLEEDATARFDALVKDRDALKAEVTRLRQSLEELQAKHESELEAVQTQLDDTQGEKESAEEQYQNLLGKVNTIRSQLAERMKSDAVRTTSIDRTNH